MHIFRLVCTTGESARAIQPVIFPRCGRSLSPKYTRLGSNALVDGVSRAGNRYTRCSHAGDLSGAVRRGPARRSQVADVDQDADQSVNGEKCEEGIGMDRATRL